MINNKENTNKDIILLRFLILSLEYRYFKHAVNLDAVDDKECTAPFQGGTKTKISRERGKPQWHSQYPQAGMQDSTISGNLQKDCTEQNMRKLPPLRSECGALPSSHLTNMKLICLDRQLHDPGAKHSVDVKGCTV